MADLCAYCFAGVNPGMHRWHRECLGSPCPCPCLFPEPSVECRCGETTGVFYLVDGTSWTAVHDIKGRPGERCPGSALDDFALAYPGGSGV